jgi:hypothetical protein
MPAINKSNQVPLVYGSIHDRLLFVPSKRQGQHGGAKEAALEKNVIDAILKVKQISANNKLQHFVFTYVGDADTCLP